MVRSSYCWSPDCVDQQIGGPYEGKHTDGHYISYYSGHSDCRSPCDSYVVKHADGYHLASHQTVDHKLRSPYMVNILGGHRTAGH